MAKIALRKFKPTAEEIKLTGIPEMTNVEIIEQLAAYKAQNPAKYEAKKAALFARYGLTLEEEKVQEPDENDKELEALKVKAKKTK